MGPNERELAGRERPEDIADEIMNQSDEGIDDLLEGTELDELDFVDGDFSLDEEFDDGGDYTDF